MYATCSAYAHTCTCNTLRMKCLCRLQTTLGWQQELAVYQLLASGSASTLQHADPGAAVTRMFTRGPQADPDLSSQRHIIVNLLSVIVRVPDCHMATHMRQPEFLYRTWLVGTTYSSVAAHYDCGCILDEQHMPVNARAGSSLSVLCAHSPLFSSAAGTPSPASQSQQAVRASPQ